MSTPKMQGKYGVLLRNCFAAHEWKQNLKDLFEGFGFCLGYSFGVALTSGVGMNDACSNKTDLAYHKTYWRHK